MTMEDLQRFLDIRSSGVSLAPNVAMKDLYGGVMLGVAAGNALGLPVEGHSRRAVWARFPGGLREVAIAERECPWDDDLAQTAILAEALLAGDELDLTDLAVRLVRWADGNGRGIGNLTHRVIAKLASGTPAGAAARLVWEGAGRGLAGNGAVMRCAPVALRWRESGRRLIEETKKSALVTHYDPRCVWSAVALNGVIALSLVGVSPDLEQLAALLDGTGAPAEVGTAVRRAQGCSLQDLDLDNQTDMGYTLKAMQVGLWAFQQESDFERVLVEVINAGGDTDTNGAVAGAVMGSHVGQAGIPPRWLDNIRDTDYLIHLADRMFEAAG